LHTPDACWLSPRLSIIFIVMHMQLASIDVSKDPVHKSITVVVTQ